MKGQVMKYSLTADARGHPSVIDLIAEHLAKPRNPARDERSTALKPSVLERLERALWRSRQREIERALDGATDAADLEAKLRRLEWRTIYRYY
jgi:hypothetical protein